MIIAFFVLFFLILLWNAFTPAMNGVFNSIEPLVNDTEDARQVFGYLHMSWKYYPILILLGVVIYILVRGIIGEAQQY